jgi:hypothetical protein
VSAQPGSVLVGFADALAAPEVAASLLGAGYRVSCFARRGRPVALRKLEGVELVEVTAPEDDLAVCASEVAKLAAEVDLTMPLDDQAVLVCDQGLHTGMLVAGPRAAQARLALDKRLQLRAAEAAGLDVPPWVELSTAADAAAELPMECQPPAVLKPALAAEERQGRLRRLSPQLVSSPEQAVQLRREWGQETPVVMQRWVTGTGAGVFGLADEGGVHHLSAHRRVRMMNPAGSGSSACASTPVPPQLVAPIERMLTDAGWRGMFMVELLRAGETWWFMELNGRPWGSLALTRRLGFEYPAWAAARALDPNALLPQAPPVSEELVCRHLGRELVHLLFVLRGPGSHSGEWPGRGATMRSLLESPRRSAWYNTGPGMRGVFIDDTLQTVATQTWRKRRRP